MEINALNLLMWSIYLEKTYSGRNRQKWPKKKGGQLRLINGSSCIEKPLES